MPLDSKLELKFDESEIHDGAKQIRREWCAKMCGQSLFTLFLHDADSPKRDSQSHDCSDPSSSDGALTNPKN